MPFASFCCDVEATVETLWRLLEDKIENPGKYLPAVEDVEILERSPEGILRRMRTAAFEVTERITANRARLEIDHALIGHPQFVGNVINKITPPREDEPDGHPLLTFTLDWRTTNGKPALAETLLESVTEGVLQTKELAERAEQPQQAKT